MDGFIDMAQHLTQDHSQDRALLALAEARVPRYTSYPTAAQFGALEEARYRDWLRQGVRPGDTLSLYVHVPFCRELCWYCACHTKPTRSAARIRAYTEALLAEVALLAESLPPHAGVSHLHLGGGTPSILGAEGLGALLAALRERFHIRDDAELAIELDPRLLDEALAGALAGMGFNRASLGVQDIAPEVQSRIGRPQPAEQVARAMKWLRAAGIGGINLDLMYGLPGQTIAHVEASARFAAWLRADRVAVFGYAHVPWMRPHQQAIDATLLPGVVARLGQAERAEAVLRRMGYEALGLDHFALPGDPLTQAAREGSLRRNFQGYTTDRAPVLLGLGPSAIGSLPGGHAQNETDERRYREQVQAGHLPVVRGVAATREDRQRAALIERLMCDFALDIDAQAESEPGMRAILDEGLERMLPLCCNGLVRREGARLEVLPAGRRFVRQVAACFDAYLAPGAKRHSAAV
ncbi:Oxygen-independent coproporphyrinogen-III oxidase [Roseomonas mucosa]|uniref:Coproporphyrinogen-III oxidase n=1 Tax=Roseomonas mucosa TaxID=207340 RepID=A0A379N1Z3_9PROT|nr:MULTISPECIES: oxygen-independent coproporphyrinogen III oxidase [Roseomonas]MCG7350638.1 oxygen-independent coproporphyrinogen III oxidase [Roseomonas mucosa]MCG7358165.1 oxygen-independent coproporphyrinogen III oxidase [Roseomonas mucosa]MDT8290273.1 oxygen-independent coproporphyrinogen III oxidase [Roseomonas mucosa]MDT8294878.1 oxygen-independent coproporphyrinogen III oxidase [Roseomonas mucosa]MDT8314961.1 oxygen-independent coproporphyrinogen III oxidase [Roseomonas mucosa]